MKNVGYYSQPSLYDQTIVFVSDDDLWKVSTAGGTAIRLTSKEGTIATPRISPDGKWVAYVGNESGNDDVYLISIDGGESMRLTFVGVSPGLTWKNESTLVFHSNFEKFHRAVVITYELNIHTLEYRELNLGPVSTISFHAQTGRRVLGRNSRDSARWKRYQGGTAGKIWVEDEDKKGNFSQILKSYHYNLASPQWLGERIYFVSDHEGVGNLYSVLPNGRQLKRHTHFEEFYVRNIQTDGVNFVFHAGADLYFYETRSGQVNKLDVEAPTSAIQARERFESSAPYLNTFCLGTSSDQIAVSARGQIFSMHAWLGGAVALDQNKHNRYRHVQFLKQDESLIASRQDHEGEEHLVVIDLKKRTVKPICQSIKWGKIWSLTVSPEQRKVAVTNNKNELWVIDPNKGAAKKIVQEAISRVADLCWSPDERYIAYSTGFDQTRTGVKIFDFKSSKVRALIEPISTDASPSFDPSGKYLFFLGVRELRPMYSETHFELSFPMAIKPYVAVLDKKTAAPFELPFHSAAKKTDDQGAIKKSKKPEKLELEIDFDGIEHRILALPVAMGGYVNLSAGKNKVFYTKTTRVAENPPWDLPESEHTLYQYSFETGKEEIFQKAVTAYCLNSKADQLLMKCGKSKLRLVSTDSLPKTTTEFTKADGWINLSRASLQIDPRAEWAQMFREAWVLQREHFWTEDMSKVDWQNVFELYSRVLPRVKTRSEFSDLMWEMQGELGTSHCYEFEGDYYLKFPRNYLGRLGAKFQYQAKDQSFLVKDIFKGDSWLAKADSALARPGVSLSVGDRILAVNGVGFSGPSDLDRSLENRVDAEIQLRVQRTGRKDQEDVTVKALASNMPALYRQWVEANKSYVHKTSNGKIGYLHVPDMMSNGFAEFYRHFIGECGYDALIVDVRFNGGGHVSQHLLKILAQKVVGVDVTRWNGNYNYPMYGLRGPVVALTNEYAGSDGDIFSHAFKLMKIGKLVGKRTWGGVIGINGQYQLSDKTTTTQPEFSHWFEDVGYSVENYGTDPDIEVERTPQDWATGADPQLDAAIKTALMQLKANPAKKFDISKKPNLRKPKLPKVRLAKD